MRSPLLLIAPLLLLLPAQLKAAETLVFTIDPSRSSLELSGTWDGVPIGPTLSPEDLTNSFAGTITAEYDSNLQVLQITGAEVAAQNDPSKGLFTPFQTPANYGFQGGSLAQPAAIRNLSFSLASAPITSPASFDTSQITSRLMAGSMDYALISEIQGELPGPPTFTESDASVPLSQGGPLGMGAGSFVQTGGFQTLTVPVTLDFSLPTVDGVVSLQLNGEFVAVTEAPEPAAFAVLVLGATTFLSGIRRRSRR